MRPVARVLAVLTTSALFVGGLAGTALAASPALVSTTPTAGANVKAVPGTISATFDQNLRVTSTISVSGPGGAKTCSAAPVTAKVISCTTSGSYPDGAYTVSYNAVPQIGSTDPATAGSFGFVIDTVAPVAPTVSVSPSPYVAASTTLTVSGTTEKASDVVKATINGVNHTATGSTSYAIPFTRAELGTDSASIGVSVVATDAAGNASAAATTSFLKDTVLPAVSSTNPGDGGSAKPASFAYAVQASETLGAASEVQILDSTSSAIEVTPLLSGSTLTVTPTSTLPEGAYTAKITLVDAAGNTAAQVTRTFTIDSTSPAAPVISPLAVINLANQAAYTVSGTGENGATVSLTIGSITQTATVSGTSWSKTFNASSLPDGPVSATATQTDGAGNASVASSPAATTTKDTAKPTVTGLTAAPATLNIGHTTATVTGTVVPAEADGVVITVNDTDAATAPVTASGTADGTGAFSIAVPTAALSDGTLTYSAVATDAAGNPSTAVTTTNTKDTGAPTQPTVVISPNPINNSTKTAVTLAGTADAGLTVTLTSGAFSTTALVDGTGHYSKVVDLSGLTDGTVTISATTQDAAGNTSPTGTGTAAKDTGVPTPPTTSVPAYITSSSATISGTAEAGATVNVSLTDGTHTVNGSGTATGGSYSVTLATGTLNQGTVTWSATATDAAGNTSTPATTTSIKDTVAPAQPTATATPSPLYRYTDDTLTVSGTATAETGLTAEISVADSSGATSDLTATVTAASGSYSKAFTKAQVATLVDGTLTVTVVVRDVAGNASTSRVITLTKDTTQLALVSTTPVDGSSNNAPPTASASYNETLNSSTTTMTVKNKNSVAIAGTRTFTGGTVTFTPSTPFAEAAAPFTATVVAYDVNDAGDTVTTTFTFGVDNTAPVVPTIVTVTNPINNGNKTSVSVTGNATEQGLTVIATVGGVSKSGTSGAGGAYTISGINVSAVADGTLAVTVQSKDAANNASPTASTTTLKETVAPTLVSGVPANGSTVKRPAAVTQTYSEALQSGTITITGVPGSTTVNGSTLTFTPTSPLADGTYTADGAPVDSHGNPGTGSTTFTVDGTAPVVSSLAATATSKGAQTTTVSGTRSESSSVSLTVSSGASTSTKTLPAGTGPFSTTFDLTGFPDGTVTVSATPTDAVGNVGSAATATAARDTTAPTVSGLAATPVTGTGTTTTVTGTTGEAGDSVVVTVNGTVTKTVTSTGVTGAFTAALDVSGELDGTLTVTAVATDTAPPVANTGPTASTTTTKDTAGPVITGLAATATNVATPSTTVTGSRSEAASVLVKASDGTTTVQQTVPSGTGGFSAVLDLSTLADGAITVTAVGTDGGANTGATATTTTTKDATAPTVTGLAATPTNATTKSTTVTGTRSETATVLITASDSGSSVSVTVDAGSGDFTQALDLSPLANGPITVTAVPTDTAGNAGATATTSTSKDATAPTVTGLAATATSAGTPSTTVTGTRSEASSVLVSATDGTTTVSATVVSGTDGFTQDLDLSTLADGTITVLATATDGAGNTGATASTTTTKDASAPTVTGLAATATNAGTPSTTVTGTRSEASSVALSATDGVTTVTGSVPSGTGGFTATLDLSTLLDGTITVSAVATDGSSNAGSPVTASTTKDSVVPVLTGLAGTATNVNAPSTTVSGSRSEVATVALSATDTHRTVTGTVTAASGAFSQQLDLSTLLDGTVTITATPTDAAGNQGAAYTTTVKKDATAPTVTGLSASLSTTIGNRSEASSVALSATDGVTTLTATVASGTGTFSKAFDLTSLKDGPVTVTAIATDTAGNAGPVATATLTKDTTGPTITSLMATAVTSASPSSTISGNRSEAASVALTATDGTHTVTGTVASGTGSFSVSLNLSTLTDGTVTVTAKGTDTSSNVGPTATTTTSKSTAPVASSITLGALPVKVLQATRLTLKGQVNRADKSVAIGKVQIAVRNDAGTTSVLATVQPAADGTFSFGYAPSYNGSYAAVYQGDARNKTSLSPVRRTLVAARLTAATTTGAATTNAVIRGGVAPNKAGQVVTLYSVSSNGTLTRIATTKVNSSSGYAFSIRLSRGNHLLQVGIGVTGARTARANEAGAVRFVAKRT